MGLEIGILIFGYNRPEMLENQIRFAIGTKLNVYVKLDGPKENSFEANKQCSSVIEKYKSRIKDYSISSINKGCNLAVTEGITWAFEHEEALIILEDDVVVDHTFLTFACTMLNFYELDKNIGGISAMNVVPQKYTADSFFDYRATCFTSSWGWATWKDRWDSHLQISDVFPKWGWDFPTNFWTPIRKSIWKSFFAKTKDGIYDAWDFRWQHSNWVNQRLTIIPNMNLGLNLGFGPQATHTHATIKPAWLPIEIEQMPTVLKKRNSITCDLRADKWMAKNHYGATAN